MRGGRELPKPARRPQVGTGRKRVAASGASLPTLGSHSLWLMKVKCQPEDFQVEELTDFPLDGGPYAVYRLTKRGVGTPEAVELVARCWNLPRRRIAYGGLKDRHALTTQHVTIHAGPQRNLTRPNLTLEYLGQASRPFQPSDIRANRFVVVVRDVRPSQVPVVERALQAVETDGLANYFDDQRFGSVGASGQFVAVPWCRGDYERALWLALAEPYEHDRSDEKRQKRLLRQHWGDWARCKELLGRSHRRSLVSFLADRPNDFRGALARLRQDLRSLYLAAFQSHVWNRLLAEVLRQECGDERLVPVRLRFGPVPFPCGLSEAERGRLSELTLPLPSARIRHEIGPYGPLVERILSDYGLTLRQMRVKYPRDSFFAKGWRRAWVVPSSLSWQFEPDERYSGHSKVTLRFELPRGSYATLLVKRLAAETEREGCDEPE